MKNIYTTTLRLNLDNVADREAWEHLQRLDRAQYRSVNRAVITAVNAYFGRQEQLAADPYLETREKEDAFLREIQNTIWESLQTAAAYAGRSSDRYNRKTGGIRGYGRRAGLCGQLLIPKLPFLIEAMIANPAHLIPHTKARNIVPPKTGCLIPTTVSFSRFLLPRKERFVMTTMTAEEKKLIQAQHRLEEAQMRAKEKARKARTRRLIQEGAVLEKVLPEVQTVGLSELEGYLNGKMSGNEENGS